MYIIFFLMEAKDWMIEGVFFHEVSSNPYSCIWYILMNWRDEMLAL